MVWRQLWIHVLDCKMSSLQYINFIINQLPKETVEQTITFTFANLNQLIAYYIPTDQVLAQKTKMFPILMDVLQKDVAQSVKDSVVDSLWSFISTQEHAENALKWFNSGNILASGGNELYKLSAAHKRSLVCVLHKSSHVTAEVKSEILEEVTKGDNSDLSNACKLKCEASTPDLAVKERIW